MVFALAGDSTITNDLLDALDFAIIYNSSRQYSVPGLTPFHTGTIHPSAILPKKFRIGQIQVDWENVKRKHLSGLVSVKMRYDRKLWTDGSIWAGQKDVKSRRTGAVDLGPEQISSKILRKNSLGQYHLTWHGTREFAIIFKVRYLDL